MPSHFAKMMEDPKFSASYQVDAVQSDILEDLAREMKAQGVTKAELARRLSITRAAVQRIFADTRDARLSTLVKVAHALEMDLAFSLKALRKRAASPALCVQRARGGTVQWEIGAANNVDAYASKMKQQQSVSG